MAEATQPPPGAGREARRAALRRRLAPWFVGLPFGVLAVLWCGLLATVDDPVSLGWLAGMWAACLVLLPLAVVGAVWAGRLGERGTMWWGVVAAVVCLPGFAVGVFMLPFLLQGLVPSQPGS